MKITYLFTAFSFLSNNYIQSIYCSTTPYQEYIKTLKITPSNTGRNRQLYGNQNNILNKTGTIQFSLSEASLISEQNVIEVQFFDDEAPIIFYKKSSTVEQEFYYWNGISDYDGGEFNMMVVDDELYQVNIVGSVSFGDQLYLLKTLPDGTVVVEEAAISDLPKENHVIREEVSDRNLRLRGTIMNKDNNSLRFQRSIGEIKDSGDVIDVMCVYTQKALCNYVGLEDCDVDSYKHMMDQRCQLAIDETNTAYTSSGVLTKLRLVYSGPVEYDEAHGMCDMLDEMSRKESLKEIRNLRDKYGADLVGMIVDNMDYCGCGYYFNGKEQNGYFVANWVCMTGYYSFGHEIGHNMGCYHDGAFHDPDNKFRTVLGLDCESKSCPRVQYFSTKDTSYTYKGKRIGDAQHDNVNKINSVRYTVANFRQSQSNVNTFSSPPTQAPKESSPCPPSSVPITISFKTDMHPNLIGWRIFYAESNKTVIKSDKYNNPNQHYSHVTCLAKKQCYKFSLRDRARDGLQKNEIYVYLDGVRILPKAKSFKQYYVTNFCT